jgi:hypothetical protein
MESVELYSIGTEIFKAFRELAGVEGPFSQRHLAAEAQRFRLWAHSLGLHQQGHASLDYRVRDAMIVKGRLAGILGDLKDHLESLLSIMCGERLPFEQEDNESSSSDTDNEVKKSATSSVSDESFHEVDFRQRSVTETLDALYSLAAKIRNPRNRPQRTTRELFKHMPTQLLDEYIQERETAEIAIVAYVQHQNILEGLQCWGLESASLSQEALLEQYASPSNFLIRRTGIANTRRKQQFVYWKEHAERISRGPTTNVPVDQLGKEPVVDETMSLPSPQVDAAHKLRAPSMRERSLATSATRLDETFVKLDDLKSVISHQSRVSTLINPQGEMLEWPPPPKQATDTKFFACPYCHVICPWEYLAKDPWR